ncbi:XS domain-containing protein [Abeliophyllum distichum]|uniref:XS domain-containing protein n=1 Tax=Abeliophyllum distichum TaxID=126358 RepID=A0ABD1TEF7_9LAMI
MTRERRYVLDSRVRLPPPQRRTQRYRDFSPSRRQEYSSRRGDRDDLHARDGMRESERSRRNERRDHFDRDLDLQAARFSDDHDRDRDIDRERDRERDSYRYEDGVGHSRRLYGEDSLTGYSASIKFQQDCGLDDPQNSDGFNVTDYHGVSDTNITRVSGEGDYYAGNQYLNECRSGLPARSRYLGGNKPSPLETERTRRRYTDSYTLCHVGVDGLPKSLGGYDIGARHAPSLAFPYLSTDTHKDGDFHSIDELHLGKKGRDIHSRDNCYLDKKDGHFRSGDELNVDEFGGPIDREIYKYNGEDNRLSLRGYLKGDVDNTISSSRPKDYAKGSPGFSSREDLYVPSNVTRMRTGMTSKTIGCDGGSGEKSQNRSPMKPSQHITSYTRSYFGSVGKRRGAHFYPEFGRSDMGCSSTRSSELSYGKTLTDVKEYRSQDTSRTDFMDPVDVIDESSKICIKDVGLWNRHASSRGQLTRDYYETHHASSPGQLTHKYSDMHGSSYARKQDDEVSGYGSTRLSYNRELYQKYGTIEPQDLHCNEMDGGPWTCEERSDVLRLKEYDPCLDRIDDSPYKRLAARDLSRAEPSEMKLKRKHVMGEKLHKHGVDRNGVRKSYHQGHGGEDVDPVSLSKKFKSSKYDYEKIRESSKMADYQSSCEKLIPNHSINHHMSGARDIKKRLGPCPQKLHVMQRIVKKYKPSLGKRLGPSPKNHARFPWLKKSSSKKFPRVQDYSGGSPDDIVGDHLEDNVLLEKPEPPENPEPPEKSDEFKQLVQSAFFKFIKQTSEMPTERKTYMEKVKTYSLKCLVCGSNSDEFVDKESLAIHAFTSTKVGLRSQHLGLHKALCVLMGWKSAEDFSRQWLCEVMSDAETSSIKEDLIIWPPVVIIHDSTIGLKNPDEQVIISTDALESKLRDMGFGNVSKVCIGKPANQSVMLAKFNGTLSGLQEAERLHKYCLEIGQGGIEFLQFMSSEKGSCSEGTQTVPAEKEEKFLYCCYLGLLEDLDKLDFNTKKRCVVRSKRELHCIADAPLNT